MTDLLTAAQMREIEQTAIDAGGVTGLDLMERAGRGVVEAVFDAWPQPPDAARRAAVLCGPGNNGGDGFVVARLLKDAGWEVEVFLYGLTAKLPADAQVNCERWAKMGPIRPIGDFNAAKFAQNPAGGAHADCIVDALFGAGLSRPLTGDPAQIAATLARMEPGTRPPVVCIDMPSGICADSGRILGTAMPSELVVTFHLPKRGHFLSPAAARIQSLVVKDIGLPGTGDVIGTSVALTRLNDNADLDMITSKNKDGHAATAVHKYNHGHALILSGGVGHGGAARMSARGALRIGAGLVTVGCPPAALIENAAQLNAIMLRSIRDADAPAKMLEDVRVNVVCAGPGLGMTSRESALVATALCAKHKPFVVLDGDALTLVARDHALFDALHDRCVLTPHGGEFARLFPDMAARLKASPENGPAFSKIDATRAAAERAGCVVVFKGPDTVIAHPDGRCSVNSAHYERAVPWLATAGAGDVLAGFIAGLLARGFDTVKAAQYAAWLHVECALSFGPGLIAEDLPDALPKVLSHLLR